MGERDVRHGRDRMSVTERAGQAGGCWSGALASLALVELSASGTVVAVNERYCELVGRSAGELVGRSPVEYTHPDDAVATRALIDAPRRSARGVRQLEARYVLPDRTVRWVRVSVSWCPEQQRTLGHVTDISDLVSARRRQEALVQHSADVIFVVGRDGRITDMNPAAVRLFGNAAGRPIADALREGVVAEHLAAALRALDSVASGPGVHPPVTLAVRTDAGAVVFLSAIADNQLDDPAIAGIIVNAHDVTLAVEQHAETERHQQALVAALVRTTEFRDPYTAGHQLKVADLAERIGQALGLPERTIAEVSLGASLHDIGKIATPAEILTRPGALSAPEMDIVRSHCRVGFSILEASGLPDGVTDTVLHHHERLDGSGYPDGLVGDEIGLHSRIVAVADVIEAMTSHRPYRPALGLGVAREEVLANRRRLYDPDVVDAAVTVTARPAGRRGAPARRRPAGVNSAREAAV
ncbi:MAG TPA: HD domain-containing phosphohydrolase [Acidimicrobiales bacterium]|nr:HD domain-containing phosphohydrolase [Acidimicrobiales bacterium]